VSHYQQQAYNHHAQEAWASPQRHAAAAAGGSIAASIASSVTSSPGAMKLPHPPTGTAGTSGGTPGYGTPPPSSSRPASGFGYARDAAAAGASGSGVPGNSAVVHHDVLGRSFITSPATHHQEEVPIVLELPSDPMGQARHLTVLVHRLTSKPSEEVLAELVACAKDMSKEAWDPNFTKVTGHLQKSCYLTQGVYL
jgi:hypothetical protein